MAVPEDVDQKLEILQCVFPKWRIDNVHISRDHTENRVKNALYRYIQTHDSQLNQNDCEQDARFVHEIFPDVPFADIFSKITMLGNEKNRVRICLRLLLFENGYKTSNNLGGVLNNDINSKETENIIGDVKNTLAAFSSEYPAGISNETNRDVDLNCVGVIKRDKIVLNERRVGDTDDPKPSTSKQSQNSPVKCSASTKMFDSTSLSNDQTFSIDLKQLEDNLKNSDIDFSEHTTNTHTEQINLPIDQTPLNPNQHLYKDTIICKNPFENSADCSSRNHQFIDLTNKSFMRRTRWEKPCTVTSSEIINLTHSHDASSDVIIENTRIPEPIREQTDINAAQRRKQKIRDACAVVHVAEETQRAPGPSGVNLAKRKSVLTAVVGDSKTPPKKSKIDDDLMNLLKEDDDILDVEMEETVKKDVEKIVNTSLQMYNDFIEKRRSNLSNDINFPEDVSDSDLAEEEFVVDEALYFPIMEIFPEACPVFLKRLCNGKVNTPDQINLIISEVLDICDYPKRKRPVDVANEITEDDQLEILIQVLPDADPTYLKQKIEMYGGDSERIKQFINKAMETKSYPTLKEYQRKQQLCTQTKQYTSDFNVAKYLEQIPDPETYFKDKTYAEFSYEERDYLQFVLKNMFNMLPIKAINAKMKKSGSITDIFNDLHDVAGKTKNQMKSRRKFSPYDTVLQNIPFLQEIAYNINRPAIIDWLESRAKLLQDRREQHLIDGLLRTCCCCYDDTLLPEEIVRCDAGCECCKDCVQRSTEVIFGQGRTDFPCIGDCGNQYSMRLLQDALSKKLFSKVAQKQQLAEVRAAGLEDLEQCPFCDFANIPSRDDRLFRCFNPDCMKESCRQCKEPNHIPLRCEELEKEADVQARVQIENKMTEALLRSCWQCQTKFIKSDGCNKMTCPKCGSFSCYVCGKSVKDYRHFNGQGGDRFDLCPLYSDTNKLHEEAVLKAAEEAMKGVDQNALKLDPTADIEKHFEEYKKNNPIVLPPGVVIPDHPPNHNQHRDANNADNPRRRNAGHHVHDAGDQRMRDVYAVNAPRPRAHHHHAQSPNRHQHRQQYARYQRPAGQYVDPWLPNQNAAAANWAGVNPQRNVHGRLFAEQMGQLRDLIGLLPRNGQNQAGHGIEPMQRHHKRRK